jgi:hypothetical protein
MTITPGHLDVPGAVTSAGMLSLLYGLSNASIHGWGSLGTLAPIGAAAILPACFGIIESRTAEPLMPLRILSNRNRASA